MPTRRSRFLLIDLALAALAGLVLCGPPAQPAAAAEGAVYVEYDPAAPFDGERSYVCLADLEKDSTTGQRRTLDCQHKPLVEICGKNDDGTALGSRCDNLLPGAGTPPTPQQAAALRTALEAHFEGNLTKLNYVIAQIGLGGQAAYEMNWQPGPSGSSPDIGGWNDATATEREVLRTPLEVIDPDNPDSRFGNTTWRHPDGDEWTALLPMAQLDKVEAASRALLLQETATPPTTAEVAARATQEVVNCRGDSISAIRTDIDTGLRAAGGASGLTRPPAIIDCLAAPPPPTPTPPPPPPPPPTPQTYTACDGTVHATQADANAVTCPTPTPPPPPQTYTACDGTTHSSQSAANAVDCSSDEEEEEAPEPEPTQTCWDGSEIPTSESCPPEPPPTPTITCWDGSSVEDAGDCPTPDYGGGGDDDDDDGNTGGGGVDDPDDDPLPVTGDPICTVGECEGEDSTTVPEHEETFEDCEGNSHSSQADADAVTCPPPNPGGGGGGGDEPDDLNDCEGGPECPYNPNNQCDWTSLC